MPRPQVTYALTETFNTSFQEKIDFILLKSNGKYKVAQNSQYIAYWFHKFYYKITNKLFVLTNGQI